jgi:integrase/recombinase XerD
MATVKITPGDHANKKNLVCVYILITHKRQKARIPIKGLKITADNWHDKKFIKESETTVLNPSYTNERLVSYYLKALQTINRLASDNALINMSVTDLANEISLACFNSNSKIGYTFGTYTDTIIEQLSQSKKYGNAECYADAKSFILRRMGRDIQFSELTYNALKRMEALHYADGKGVNSLSFFMRTIRAIYNRAVKDKIVTREYSPFLTYKIKHEETAKRAISLEDFKKLKDVLINPKKSEFHAQKFFLFSFYARGMNFTDLAYLKVSDIADGRIIYKRAKTKKNFTLAIIPQIQEILDFYIRDKSANDYVFPIIKTTEGTDVEQRNEVLSERRNYNKRLDRVAKAAKVPTGLTSYVTRHSWATISKFAGLSVALISEGLGHSDTRTTEIYLSSFPDDVMDQASLLIANLLLDKPKNL